MASINNGSGNKANLDPYTEQAESHPKPTEEKIAELKKIVKTVKCSMMTTRDSSGHLHSRAMEPCSPFEHHQLTLYFFANNASSKFDEIENDPQTNLSFYDESSTNWISVSGVAKITQDKELIHKYWSHTTASYFGNLNDGVHKGDQNDPRVSIIVVEPSEIRFWVSTKSNIGKAIDTAATALSGRVTAPGQLHTITSDEIKLVRQLHGSV